ncbi:MAG: trypsin-like peptidase domain-containing protein [Candidatus Andersenbacteria bacterium]|nr:trypsin-like peptidase domain-containing protein [bacterium]MDZ4225669.1 trypsin-like peptidase domain-containing protein [Candidatus Andersenbacteria bacterium]
MEKFLGKFGGTIVVGFVAGLLGAMLVLATTLPGGLNFKTTINALGNSTAVPAAESTGSAASSGQPDSVVNVVKETSPAVVSVVITKDVPVLEQYYPSQPFNNFFGNPFFNFNVPQLRQNGTQKQEVGGGSGFLVSADGMIITNKHVVDQTDAQYSVLTNDGKTYDATVIARDPSNDIAVLKIDANNMPFLQFDDSDQLQVGQTLIAIGNALGEFRNTVSVGVLSGVSRSITAGDGQGQAEHLSNVIQTDAAINPGNSGGPLLNLSGKVVGVNVAIAQSGQNIGFALPSNLVKGIAETVAKTGRIIRPFLGIRYVQITPALKDQNKLSVDYGVLIARGSDSSQLAVVPGSPADKAGLQENDIILEVGGQKLDENTSLSSMVSSKNVGDTLTLKVLHQGQEKTVTVTLAEVPQQ